MGLYPGNVCVSSVLLLLLVSQCDHVIARSWNSEQLPNPQDDAEGTCGRGSVKSAVCDPDGILSPSDADTIDGLINFIEAGSHGYKKVPCKGSELVGAQIAVAIFDRMSRGTLDFSSKEDRALQFARDLHDRWGVGDARCQNGIVLVFSIQDRAMGFSTGAGVKDIFTDAMIPSVMAEMKPKMKRGQYGPAIIDGVGAIGNILSGGDPPVTTDAGSLLSIAFVIAVMFIACCTQCCTARRNRRYNRCKKVLEKLDKDRDRAGRNEYVATSCPICLEDFPPEGSDAIQSANSGATANNETSAAEAQDQESSSFDSSVRRRVAGVGVPRQDEDSEANSPMVLPCGHKFHKQCIMSWVSGSGRGNQQCPICRRPIVEEERVDSRSSETPGGWDMFEPEYSFRLQRANYFYPDYVTLSMINSWERDRYNNRPIATSSVFVAVDPVVIAAAARASGGGGSSFSFGGGSSGGGGGGGGGW